MLYLTFDVIPSRISVISVHLFTFLDLPSYYLSNILGWLISSSEEIIFSKWKERKIIKSSRILFAQTQELL